MTRQDLSEEKANKVCKLLDLFEELFYEEQNKQIDIPLHIKYRHDGEYFDIGLWIEIDGEVIDLEIYAEDNEELAQKVEAFARHFGKCTVYEQ